MQVSRTDKSPTLVLLKINADTADLEPIKKHVLGHFAKQAKVPGFRAGKAPANLLEKHVDQKALIDEFLEHAINDLYKNSVQQQKLRPVGSPSVQIKKFVPYTQLEFEASLETIGPIKLPNYKTLKIGKKKVEIRSKDVETILNDLRLRSAKRQDVQRPAKDGDELIIDFAGKDASGKPVAGADAKDYPLILGQKSFIPGFEENLIGLKPNQSKDFDITFPKNYGVQALQAKKVNFAVTVKKINELIKPKLDDTFATTVGPFKTLAELKNDIKKQLTVEKNQQAQRDYENELVRKITEKSQVEIPESLITDQITQMEEDEKRNLIYRGQTWQEHLKEEGVTEEQHRERQKPSAAERVKAGLVLSEIADREGLRVTDEEIQMHKQLLKNQYKDPQMLAEIDKPENQRDLAARLLTEKTLQKLTKTEAN